VKPLTFEEFSKANRARCEAATGFDEPLNGTSTYTLEHWALTICEEAGEVAAAVMGVSGKKRSKSHLTDKDVAFELADVVTYCDLLAQRLGFDLGKVLAAKFDKVSDRIGWPGPRLVCAADVSDSAAHIAGGSVRPLRGNPSATPAAKRQEQVSGLSDETPSTGGASAPLLRTEGPAAKGVNRGSFGTKENE
jgi:NTP pyrophosphatase (non-canonical NTP hydrolase)